MSYLTNTLTKPQAKGVIYICTGKRGNLLRNSIASLQVTNSEIPIFLIADRPYDVSFQWVESWTDMASRRIKTQLWRYTPFELTLYVDTDIVFKKSIDLGKMIGDADLALAIDCCPTLKQARSLTRWPHHVSHQEVEETISLCGENHPFFNGGVMLWRNNSSTLNFFKHWHDEWLKYQNCDQFALLRALISTKIPITILPSSYNSAVFNETCAKEAHIYHLLGKEEVAKRFGFWNPPLAGPFEMAYSTAIEKGFMSENQYRNIAHEIYNHRPCSLLVVGNGCDIDFWSRCVGHNILYVTESTKSISIASDHWLKFGFKSRVEEWGHVAIPPQVNRKWDYVIVQGPHGYDNRSPGRQIPIAWASQLAQKAIFILDYDRPWERKICDHYLGGPDYVVDADERKDRKLAIFYIKTLLKNKPALDTH